MSPDYSRETDTQGLQKKPQSRVDKEYTKRNKSGPAFPAHRRKRREECGDHRQGGLGGFSQWDTAPVQRRECRGKEKEMLQVCVCVCVCVCTRVHGSEREGECSFHCVLLHERRNKCFPNTQILKIRVSQSNIYWVPTKAKSMCLGAPYAAKMTNSLLMEELTIWWDKSKNRIWAGRMFIILMTLHSAERTSMDINSFKTSS